MIECTYTDVTCAELNLPNAFIIYQPSSNGLYPINTKAYIIECNGGYFQSGPNLLTCQASGEWSISIQAPSCILSK